MLRCCSHMQFQNNTERCFYPDDTASSHSFDGIAQRRCFMIVAVPSLWPELASVVAFSPGQVCTVDASGIVKSFTRCCFVHIKTSAHRGLYYNGENECNVETSLTFL